MSKKRQAGYDQAKQQHQEGRSIEALILSSRDLPASQYTLGFMTYITDVQYEEHRQRRAAQ